MIYKKPEDIKDIYNGLRCMDCLTTVVKVKFGDKGESYYCPGCYWKKATNPFNNLEIENVH